MIHPSQLRKMRIMNNMSQRKLAEISGISQSTISMIESGKCSPRIETMEKLSKALTSSERTIGEIMTGKVVYIRPEDSSRRAKILMKKHSISQLPVISGDMVVGTVRESDLIDKSGMVKDIMSHPLPQLDVSTPASIAKELLKSENAVIVTESGKIAGIVTKSDLI